MAVWATGTAIAAGALRRQLAAPAVGSERVFVCIVAGTTHATTEPTWVTTRGAKTTDNTVTWQECTGIAALNGDATNTPSWTVTATPPGGVKNIAVVLGQVIKRDNGASYQICTTAGTAGNGSEPAFSDTAGTTTADNTVTWTSLGVVGNFTGWQAPQARLANAYVSTWGQAGNSFFVASEHAETQASAITLLSPGTIALPCLVYCVTKTTLPPASANLTTGATISATGANALNVRGFTYHYGIALRAGSTTDAANINVQSGSGASWWLSFEACALVVNNSNSGSVISIGVTNGGTASGLLLKNTPLTFGSTSQIIQMFGSLFRWIDTANALVGTVPTTLISANGQGSALECVGVDLSAAGAGKTLVGAITGNMRALFVDCKLGASVTVATAPAGRLGSIVDVVLCDSGATNYRQERYAYGGTQSVETTIVRTGGASDGTTPISWKIITTANSKWVSPFESIPIAIWNSTVGSAITATVCGIWGGASVPNNDDIWIEALYLGSSATPLGSFANDTKANNLATGSALPSDTSTWGGSTTKFKMTLTFTPQMAGYLNVVVKAARASSTFYVDPLVVLS